MPVTSISASVDCSAKAGASRWIGALRVALTGPRSSIGSPITLMMRPSISGPTGTVIGRPEIGRASWRDRGCQYVMIPGVAGSLKKNNKNIDTESITKQTAEYITHKYYVQSRTHIH